MRTRIFWIAIPPAASVKGRLAIMPRPRGGEWLSDEILGWREAGIETVLCLLAPDEIAELELHEEAALSRAAGIEPLAFAIPDMSVPRSAKETARIASSVATRLGAGKLVAIHCRAGIGRSSLIAACTLVQFGITAGEAFRIIAEARGVLVPDTDEQRCWVEAFAAA